MVRSSQITVGVAATKLAPLEVDNTMAGFTVVVVNRGTGSIFLGGSTAVTTGTGLEVAAGGSFSINLDGGSDEIWAIATAGTQRVDVLRAGVA